MTGDIYQLIIIFANLFLIIFVITYFFNLRAREKALEKKEISTDFNYHQIVDNAITREQKILTDATTEATKILLDAHYVNKTVKETLDLSLQKMINDIQKGASDTSSQFLYAYQNYLQQIMNHTLSQFQATSSTLHTNLQKQIATFRQTLLENLEKELESYKENRISEIEKYIGQLVQKVTRDVVNRSIPLQDHEKLVLEALEKAKRQGIFD